MKTVLKFDKFVLTKELNDKIKKVGDMFEVANVLDDSFLLREEKTKVAVGVINFEDFEKHFVPVESFKGWTPWMRIVGFNGQTDIFYRTNRKKTQVKFLTDNVRGECCCCKDDEFNLSFGIQMAYLRCLNKALAKRKAEYEEKLNAIDSDIANNNRIAKKMINSLSV